MKVMIFKDKTGKITTHAQSPVDSEFTVCSIAFDSTMPYEDVEMIEEKEGGVVDCKDCCDAIRAYKSMSINQLKY